MFWSMDTDDDGLVTFLELLRSLYPKQTPERLLAAYRLVVPEPEEQVPRVRELTTQQIHEIESIFFLYDEDGSGYIETPELMKAMHGCGYEDDELRAMLRRHDQNHDGRLDFDEFLAMMRETYK